MQTSPIVQYLQDQLAAGFTEDKLRQHLQAYGWAQPAIDSAFAALAATAPATAEPTELADAPAPKRYRNPFRFTKKWAAAMAALVVMTGVGGYFLVISGNAPKVPTASAQKITYAQRQSSDVAYLATTIVQYAQENNHQLPAFLKPNTSGTALIMCGDPCATNTLEIGALGVYKAADITYKPYATDLTVPDIHNIYAVRNAKCSVKAGIGEPNSSQQSLVLLYASKEDASLKQHCLSL